MSDQTMDGDINLFEAMYTQRAIRSFKPDPIDRSMVERMVEAATKAPSGANRQPWAFLAIDDRETLDELAAFARIGFERMYERALASSRPGDPPPFPRLKPMIESFERIPLLIIVCAVGTPEQPASAAMAGSVFPAVQNLLLAARGLGLGAALTTGWAAPSLAEIKTLLGLPDHAEPMAFIPVGLPDRERYGPTTRRPVGEVLHWGRWEEGKPNSALAVYR